jgi:cell division protease FtsH
MGWAERRLRERRDNRRIAAYHEAGHAVCARLLGVTIVEAKGKGKRLHVLSRSAGHDARGMPDFRRGLESDIQVSLAGAIAQQLYSPQSYDESQVQDDLQNAGQAAIRHCLEIGNGELGDAFRFEGELPEAAEKLVQQLYEPTINLIKENWHKVERVAAAFLEHGELTQAEIDAVMADEMVAKW